MKRLLALLVVVVFLWPAAARAAVSLCAISGQVFNPDGTTLNNGTVQFNSQVTQVVGSTTIPPSIISTTTDGSGNMAPMSVAQGLFGTFTFCQGHSQTNVGGPGGGCAAAINGLIPINTTGNIQSVIAGVLLPSVGNATVNNITVTNIANIATLQAGTLAVNSNATIGGTLNVTGNTTLSGTLTTTGPMTGTALTLTSPTCSALTLAQGSIASVPPNSGLIMSSGAHCTGTGTFIADSNSAVLFGNFINAIAPTYNAGWQWLGNTGLTVGSTFIPTLTMSLSTTPAFVPATVHTGTLRVSSLILDNSTTTALTLPYGSLVSAANVVDLAAGTHWNGSSFVADQASATIFQSTPPGGGFNWYANTGLTVGNVISPNQIGTATANGWELWGTNPVAILQSTTNTNADILQMISQNGTEGIGITYQNIHAIGTANQELFIDSKGASSYIGLNLSNQGASTFSDGSIIVQQDYHYISTNNGIAGPSVSVCTGGAVVSGSTDNAGSVTFSSAGSGNCTLNFGRGWGANPLGCTCSNWNTGTLAATACGVSTNTTQMSLLSTTATNSLITWVCIGNG